MEKSEDNKLGVLEHKIENNHYIVKLRWKDGKETERHFPEKGFVVFDPQTREKKGIIDGKKALVILEKNVPNLNEDEFSWLNFVD